MATPASCVGNPDLWDMDNGDVTSWLMAIRVCTTACPMLAACWAAKTDQYGPGAGPAGMIQAGVGHTATGRALRPARLLTYRSADAESGWESDRRAA